VIGTGTAFLETEKTGEERKKKKKKDKRKPGEAVHHLGKKFTLGAEKGPC